MDRACVQVPGVVSGVVNRAMWLWLGSMVHRGHVYPSVGNGVERHNHTGELATALPPVVGRGCVAHLRARSARVVAPYRSAVGSACDGS